MVKNAVAHQKITFDLFLEAVNCFRQRHAFAKEWAKSVIDDHENLPDEEISAFIEQTVNDKEQKLWQ